MQQAQAILLAFETQAAKVGLHTHAKKIQYMNFNQTSIEPLRTMNVSRLQQVHDFKHNGAWIVSTSQDMHVRKVKVNVFQSLVKPVLLYGSETWTLAKQLERSLDGCYTRL